MLTQKLLSDELDVNLMSEPGSKCKLDVYLTEYTNPLIGVLLRHVVCTSIVDEDMQGPALLSVRRCKPPAALSSCMSLKV